MLIVIINTYSVDKVANVLNIHIINMKCQCAIKFVFYCLKRYNLVMS